MYKLISNFLSLKMQLRNKKVVIFGGTGLLGKYIVRILAKEGAVIKILSRNPEKGAELKTCGGVGQVSFVKGEISDDGKIEELIKNSDIVINTTGILFEKRKAKFAKFYIEFPKLIGELSKKYGIKDVIHISALGVDKVKNSKYAVAKFTGEKELKIANSNATIIRPSVVFGAEDNFINRFARIIKLSPIVPLVGKGYTKFQPVYAPDIALSVLKVLLNKNLQGKIYELGGPDIFNLREINEIIIQHLGVKRAFVNIPFAIMNFAASFLQLLPNPPITKDQLVLLKHDNVTQNKALTFFNLNIQPKKLGDVLKNYL
jgi:uncharacterized protein YbjT (DUF2867 family)